jgi:hypothetical protein
MPGPSKPKDWVLMRGLRKPVSCMVSSSTQGLRADTAPCHADPNFAYRTTFETPPL